MSMDMEIEAKELQGVSEPGGDAKATEDAGVPQASASTSKTAEEAGHLRFPGKSNGGGEPQAAGGFVKRVPSAMTYPVGYALQGGDPTGVAPWALGTGVREPHRQMSGLAMPVPQACTIELLQLPHTFQSPAKRIHSVADIDTFHQSKSGGMFLGFVVLLSQSIQGKKLSDQCHLSETSKAIVTILEKMSVWVEEIPPLQAPARYGNPAFRSVQCTCKMCRLLPEQQKPRYGDPAYHQWFDRMEQEGPGLVESILPPEWKGAAAELFSYFADSFGNRIRIDYGTGHEANFLAFLLCLARLGALKDKDYQAVVSLVFVKYLDLMRKLQLTYWLEPAGSHGVWGLDDYSFAPFIFGSSQLISHKYIRPRSILNDDILESFGKEYLYLAAVAFVKKVKKGPLAEHSPMINDIAAVPNWNKVNSGMLKMYKAECLEKVPIMQHFLFGSIIQWGD